MKRLARSFNRATVY